MGISLLVEETSGGGGDGNCDSNDGDGAMGDEINAHEKRYIT